MSATDTYARPSYIGPLPHVNDWNTVASFATYPEAQAAVDRLVADGFPVGYLEIVGSQLQSVEQVTGPMSTRRAAGTGAMLGASWGLVFGLFAGLFVGSAAAWVGIILLALVLGAAYGGLTGAGARRLAKGRHSYASMQGIIAGRYDLIALEGKAFDARSALGYAA